MKAGEWQGRSRERRGRKSQGQAWASGRDTRGCGRRAGQKQGWPDAGPESREGVPDGALCGGSWGRESGMRSPSGQ